MLFVNKINVLQKNNLYLQLRKTNRPPGYTGPSAETKDQRCQSNMLKILLP